MRTFLFILFLTSTSVFSQEKISDVLKKYNSETIPYIQVDSLQKLSNVIILDAREKREFSVSHLPNSVYVGYQYFDLKKVKKMLPDKNARIVVYCTLGVRSEDIAEKLKKAGYTKVLNLFGGIFEWKNKGYRVLDVKNNETENVHVCNTYWSQWLKKGKKIYE
ncbi:rhodanese-like domain-containing protein [Flavobacteriaceae bacterium S356]|uniref:Rhodanese-like domain-containing protein n=1 Tax=Asprobacillus argus TaxID=3076534 RepID=A0ABU3LAP9_9FLAO|nr:rhodanese-like domain-containing protein [Flavobacteriaceae bacterium S356]